MMRKAMACLCLRQRTSTIVSQHGWWDTRATRSGHRQSESIRRASRSINMHSIASFGHIGRPNCVNTAFPTSTTRKSRLQQAVRSITTREAKTMLGFERTEQPTMKELRGAYFQAAKKFHPDMQKQREEDGEADDPLTDFKTITDAYERLLHSDQVQADADLGISVEEEAHYRRACMQILGVPAEIVEESKQNPMFRHWLGGNTDGAIYWRSFFTGHGGLAQKLRPPAGHLESGRPAQQSESRRKRRR